MSAEEDISTGESCWSCMGEGGFHDCGEDTCCCLRPKLNVLCEVCKGEGIL